jgi:transposase
MWNSSLGSSAAQEETMFRKKGPHQEALFVPGSLSSFVPDDHILKKVDAVLDLSWLADEVEDLYSGWTGRPCIDPEQAVRLMLAGFFHGVVQDRKLMREAQVNLAYRWFARYELDDALPDHSSLTRIRQRWGEVRFRRIFERTVFQCVEAKLVGGEMTHIDASLIRADVSWESLVTVHVEKVLAENETAEESDEALPKGKGSEKTKKISTTDPEASMATSAKNQRLEPTYKQHTAVDDKAGVIVDVEVSTGEANEGLELVSQLGRVYQQTGSIPERVTADAGYASGTNYEALELIGIDAVIPPQKASSRGRLPLVRFRYDATHDVVRCPGGKVLERRNRVRKGWLYRAQACDCRACPLKQRCIPESAHCRSILIVDGYCALVRARRRKRRGWEYEQVAAYGRHRYQVEGIHGEAKCQHGLRRAVRRGLNNARIQAYLTAAVINLKRLANLCPRSVFGWLRRLRRAYSIYGGSHPIAGTLFCSQGMPTGF